MSSFSGTGGLARFGNGDLALYGTYGNNFPYCTYFKNYLERIDTAGNVVTPAGAAFVNLRLAPARTVSLGESCEQAVDAPPSPGPGETGTAVFFSCFDGLNGPAPVVPSGRVVTTGPVSQLLTATLEQEVADETALIARRAEVESTIGDECAQPRATQTEHGQQVIDRVELGRAQASQLARSGDRLTSARGSPEDRGDAALTRGPDLRWRPLRCRPIVGIDVHLSAGDDCATAEGADDLTVDLVGQVRAHHDRRDRGDKEADDRDERHRGDDQSAGERGGKDAWHRLDHRFQDISGTALGVDHRFVTEVDLLA